MIHTKVMFLILLNVLIVLSGCGWQLQTPSIAKEDVENVMQIAYLSDSNFDWKNVGEVIVIESGEHLQVRRNQIRPKPYLVTRYWDEKFFSTLEKSPPAEKVLLKLDRKNGVVCTPNHCTTLYSICPSWSEMREGAKKCVSFSRS